jgi:hypothetical protein
MWAEDEVAESAHCECAVAGATPAGPTNFTPWLRSEAPGCNPEEVCANHTMVRLHSPRPVAQGRMVRDIVANDAAAGFDSRTLLQIRPPMDMRPWVF